jgi:hypothetical protein
MRKIVFILSLSFYSFFSSAQTFPQVETIESDSLFQPYQRDLSDSSTRHVAPPEMTKWETAKSKLHYGGNAWASYFNGLFLDLSPTLGYDLNEKGTMLGLSLAIVSFGNSPKQEERLSIGPRVFVRQPIWKSIFAHGEIEAMHASKSQFNDAPQLVTDFSKDWRVSPLVGLGFYQGGGGQQRGSFISVLYNLNNSGYVSPYSLFGRGSLYVFRVGIIF